MFLGTGFSLRIFSFRSFSDKKRSKFPLTYLPISPGILYQNLSSSVMIWKYWQESVMEICLKETIWWTGRGIVASTFLVLGMFTSWTSFAGWLWSTWRWSWWWAASWPSSLFLLLWWFGRVVWKANYLMVRWKLLLQRLPIQGSNLSFSHYYCLPLFVANNSDQFFKLFNPKFKLC